MSIFVVMMVKDELDILPYVLDHLIEEDVDEFYIADNNSTDGTREFLHDLAVSHKNITVIDDPVVGYYQQAKMNGWIRQAVDMGADIIIPVDADEIWYAEGTTLGKALQGMAEDVAVAPVIDMVPQNTDNVTGNPILNITFRERDLEIFPCVAFKYHPDCSIAQGNHDVSHPGSRNHSLIKIRHFQYRSYEQFCRKMRNGKAAYDATDLPGDFGIHWREGGALSDTQLFDRWTGYINQPGLYYDPSPYSGRMFK